MDDIKKQSYEEIVRKFRESISLDRHQLERLLSGLTPITESKEGEIRY